MIHIKFQANLHYRKKRGCFQDVDSVIPDECSQMLPWRNDDSKEMTEET